MNDEKTYEHKKEPTNVRTGQLNRGTRTITLTPLDSAETRPSAHKFA